MAEPRPLRVQPHLPGARSARHIRHDRRAVLHRGSRRDLGGDAPGDARARAWRVGARRRLRAFEAFGTDPGAGRPHHAGGSGDRRAAAARSHSGAAVESTAVARVSSPSCSACSSSSRWWRGARLGVVWLSLHAFSAATTGKDAFLRPGTDQPGCRPCSRPHGNITCCGSILYRLAAACSSREQRRGVPQRTVRDDRLVVVSSPTRFSVKTTIAAMLISVLALAAIVVRWKDGREGGAGGIARGPVSTRARRCWHSSASTGCSRSPATSTSATGICCRSTRRSAALFAEARRSGSGRCSRGRIGFIADWTRTTRTEGPGGSRRAEL